MCYGLLMCYAIPIILCNDPSISAKVTFVALLVTLGVAFLLVNSSNTGFLAGSLLAATAWVVRRERERSHMHCHDCGVVAADMTVDCVSVVLMYFVSVQKYHVFLPSF